MPLDYLPLKRKFFGHYNLDFGAGAIVVTSVLYVVEAAMEYSYHYCSSYFSEWTGDSNENVVLPYVFLIILEVHALILLITALGFACGLCVGSIECAPFFVVALIIAPFIIALYYIGMLAVTFGGALTCERISPIYLVHVILMGLAAILNLESLMASTILMQEIQNRGPLVQCTLLQNFCWCHESDLHPRREVQGKFYVTNSVNT